MSRQGNFENVEIVKRAVQAWNERDETAMGALFHPDFEYHGLDEWPGLHRVFRGREEALPRQSELAAELDDFRSEPVEMIDAGARIVCILELTGIGKQSRIPVRFTEVSVVTIRDRRIVRIDVCDTRERALELSGLST